MKNLQGYEIFMIIAMICVALVIIVAMLTGNLDKLPNL